MISLIFLELIQQRNSLKIDDLLDIEKFLKSLEFIHVQNL